MTNLSEVENIKLPDMQALLAFGKVGVNMMAARILSVTSLAGVIGVSAYVSYNQSWQGVAVCAIMAFFVFGPALRAESARKGD
jgi:hypothetical protein